ncbi:MAG: glycosyltransferase [Sulfitobacter sp.]
MIRSALLLVSLVAVWLGVFAVGLVSTQELAAALPGDQHLIPEQVRRPETVQADALSFEVKSEQSALVTYKAQRAARYKCLASDGPGSDLARPNAPPKIYAVLPSALPWAAQSLGQSCGTIDTVLPEWITLSMQAGQIVTDFADTDTRAPLATYMRSSGQKSEIIPLIRIGNALATHLKNPAAVSGFGSVFAEAVKTIAALDSVTGACVDLSLTDNSTVATLTPLFASLSHVIDQAGLTSCVVLSGQAGGRVFEFASKHMDLVAAKVFSEPWVGSTPHSLASPEWFTQQIRRIQTFVPEDKLIVGIGTFTANWTSGRPKPQILPYSEAMTRLSQSGTTPEFDAGKGNARASFLDAQGLRNRMWMFDAASAHNQLRALRDAGVKNVSIWSLGQEDPGIWAVLDHAKHSTASPGAGLRTIVLDSYVQRIGQGPFVAPLSMPRVGRRSVKTDLATGFITDMQYDRIPSASIVRLYGQGQPNQVVLTFDDGPHQTYTTQTLDILQDTDTPATFFVLGHNAMAAPDLVQRILADGHEIGSHTFWHPNMIEVTASRAQVEINSVQLLVNGITGRATRLYREPFMRSGGPISSREVASLLPLKQAGYVIAGMDIVPNDWQDPTATELVDRVVAQVEEVGGGVILLHDGGGDQSQTVAALPRIIDTLKSRGYVFTTLSGLLGMPQGSLMPQVSAYKSVFQNVSFKALGNSWNILEWAFWFVLIVGLARAVILLFLTAFRQRHAYAGDGGYDKVTIVIPAYNEAVVLRRCLECVLRSNYPNFDVIVVDDGSTDRTFATALAFRSDSRVNVLTHENRGKAAALNAALYETDSEIIICIDADSQIHPHAVTLLARHFDDAKVGAVAGKLVVGNRGNLLTRLQALEYVTAQGVDRRAKEVLNAITVVPGAIGAWRTSAVLEAGIYSSETLTEDADLTMSVIRSGYRVIYDERAIASTETPASVKALMQQRLRWSLGMMQAGWKHKGAAPEGRALGLIALPDLAIFGYLMPLFAPLADLFLILVCVDYFTAPQTGAASETGFWSQNYLAAYLSLPFLELLTVIAAFRLDPTEDRRLILLIPFQRLFYRQILYVSVYWAFWRAITGSLARWGRAARVGYTFNIKRSP